MSLIKISLFLIFAIAKQTFAAPFSLSWLTFFQDCPTSPILPTFDAAKYVGLWYEIERHPNWFENGLSCVTAEYGFINATTITVKNSGTNLSTNQTKKAEGTARIPNIAEPNKLLVRFPMKFFNFEIGGNEGKYEVWATDYTSHSLVYSCSKILGFVKLEAVWILSRQKTLSDAEITKLKGLLSSNSIDISKFEKVAQNCNN